MSQRIAEKCVFKFRLKRSDSMAGSRNVSDSDFQTMGSATEKDRVPNVLQGSRTAPERNPETHKIE